MFGWRSWVTSTPSPPTSRTTSPTWVVVAIARTDAPPPELSPELHPARKAPPTTSDPARPRAFRPRRPPIAALPTATRPNTTPLRTAIVAPGGTFVSTASQIPSTPSAAARPTVPVRSAGSRLVTSRTVAAGTTSSAITSSAPIAFRAAITTTATVTRSAVSNQREPEPTAEALCSSNPLASQCRVKRAEATIASRAVPAAKARSSVPIESSEPNRRESTFAPDPKMSLARITPVARNPTRASAVIASVAAFRTRPSSEVRSVKAPAAPKARSCGEKPIPSARTRPGKVETPTAWEKKESARSTIQGPINPAATASSSTSRVARWTYGREKGSGSNSIKACLSSSSSGYVEPVAGIRDIYRMGISIKKIPNEIQSRELAGLLAGPVARLSPWAEPRPLRSGHSGSWSEQSRQ